MPNPNFFIIGAERSGTTSLWLYLKQHPDIYMSPIKEPQFFSWGEQEWNFFGPGDTRTHEPKSLVKNLVQYQSLFEKVSDEKVIGEASTSYLYSSRAMERLWRFAPSAKLIAILRNPVDRAHSAFVKRHYMAGSEPLTDFSEALQEEERRIRNNWYPAYHYKHKGYYYSQLKPYFDLFGQGQILVLLYEDLVRNPRAMLRETLRFLKVDESFLPKEFGQYNTSKISRSSKVTVFLKRVTQNRFFREVRRSSKLLDRFIRQAYLINGKPRPELSPEIRKRLVEMYREDIVKLQDLIGRDLRVWLIPSSN